MGIELVESKATLKGYRPEKRMGHQVIREARRNGVIIRPLGDVIILMPPLTISDDELKTLVDVVHESIRLVTEN